MSIVLCRIILIFSRKTMSKTMRLFSLLDLMDLAWTKEVELELCMVHWEPTINGGASGNNWYVNWELAGPATGPGNTGNWAKGKGGKPRNNHPYAQPYYR